MVCQGFLECGRVLYLLVHTYVTLTSTWTESYVNGIHFSNDKSFFQKNAREYLEQGSND